MKKILRGFDIWMVVFLAVIVFSYYKGYRCYIAHNLPLCTAWSAACAGALLALIRRAGNQRYLHMKIEKVDRLSGKAFEHYLSVQFRRLGYHVKETGDSHDFGADLLLKKHGKKYVVQAKRYEKNVGISAVQEVIGAVAWYEADGAIAITNRRFTKSAKDLAKRNEVELWDRDTIREKFCK